MYSVSKDFLDAMHDFVIQPSLKGTVGGTQFTDDDILADSFRCLNQCVEVNDVKLGGVYIGELRMTLLSTVAKARGEWIGKQINCSYGLLVGDKEEYIPIPGGTYTIYEADWKEEGLAIVAYDNMIKLDKKFSNDQSAGLAWNWLQFVSKKCGIELANTELEVAQMINGGEILGLSDVDNIETFRDLVYYLAQALCCFATIDRNGRLKLVRFGSSRVDVISASQRFVGSTFSDYTTRFTGLSVVNISEGTTSYYSNPPDTGLTMNLGQNPFLQLGTKETVTMLRRNILNGLNTFEYIPFKATVLGCCVYDLGDVIVFTEGIAQSSYSCVMSYDFGLSDFVFAGYGNNPALESAKSKSDKNISGLINRTNSEVMTARQMINIADVVISESWRKLGGINFAVTKSQTILFHAAVKTNLVNAGLVKFKYTLNNVDFDFIHEVSLSTKDTATLFLPFSVEVNDYVSFDIYIQGPEGIVNQFDFVGSILGIGILVDETGGNIEVEDTYRLKICGGLTFNYSDEVEGFELKTPISIGPEDTYSLRINGGLKFNYTDKIDIKTYEPEWLIVTSEGDYLVTSDGDNMKT